MCWQPHLVRLIRRRRRPATNQENCSEIRQLPSFSSSFFRRNHNKFRRELSTSRISLRLRPIRWQIILPAQPNSARSRVYARVCECIFYLLPTTSMFTAMATAMATAMVMAVTDWRTSHGGPLVRIVLRLTRPIHFCLPFAAFRLAFS